MNEILTPANVERRLMTLSRELDEATDALIVSEEAYHSAKTAFEIALARTRISLGREAKMTVQHKEDLALVACQAEAEDLTAAETVVKSARANIARIRTQIDIARSLGTSVRTAFDV